MLQPLCGVLSAQQLILASFDRISEGRLLSDGGSLERTIFFRMASQRDKPVTVTGSASERNQSQRGKRHDLEQFFTPFWAAERLVEEFFPDLGPTDYVADLGTGLGAFLSAVPAHVPAIGVELDPELAQRARDMTGREVICGDFRTISLPQQPSAIIGNPPFMRSMREAYLDKAYDILPENGRCGAILPANALTFSGPVQSLRDRWSIQQTLLPRNLFPRAKFPFVFVLFTKDFVRKLYGFFLFDEAGEVGGAPKAVKAVLMNGKPHRSVWRALIEDAIEAHQGAVTREQLRDYVRPRRTSKNPFWWDRLREILNNSQAFVEGSDGFIRRAAA